MPPSNTSAVSRSNPLACAPKQCRRVIRCRGVRVQCALSTQSSTAAAVGHKPPRVQGKLHLDRLFIEVHEEMVARNMRVAHAKNLLVDIYHFRHPEDVWSIVSKDDILFAKSGRVTATKEWLGNGVFSQLDLDKHTAARATLNPAFRRDYLARLDSFMKGSAQQLADILTAAAAAAAAGSECSAGVSSTASGAGVGPEGGGSTAALDMQRMFRLTTLDTLGLTGLNRSFKALSLWQQQQQVSTQDVGMSGSSSSDGQLELEQLLWDLESAFLWQALRLPVPRSWLPGWSKYIRACEELDSLINNILAETRAQQQQQQQHGPGAAAHSSDNTSSSSSSSSSRQTLVSFLLAAQQQQGADQLPDQQIRDEIKTILFGGTDTSAFTLAVCAHYLAQQPAAAERAAAEVRELLQQTGRASVAQLRAEDASKLQWVLACVNESMRLAPAGPVITRTALQDTELAGYHIPKGTTVAANLYAMHRHPDIWPEADVWLPQRWVPAEAEAAGLAPHILSSSSRSQQPFLPFSSGPRGCIGRNYALLQMVLTVAVLLGSGLRFRPGGQARLQYVKGLTMHAKGGIWLTPYINAH